MDIHEIRLSELDQLFTLYEDLHDSDVPKPSVAVVNKTWKAIADNSNIKIFGLFKTDILISSCTICLIPNLTRGCRPYGIIENVVTDKRYRHSGYGQEVLKKAINFAWKKDCYKIMLMTGRLNEKTFKFYESAGFNRHNKQAFVLKKDSP